MKVWYGTNRTTVLCKCHCGNTKEYPLMLLKRRKSCGASCGSTRHGGGRTRLFCVWSSMKSRTNNPNTQSFKYYGGRGIKVCERWSNFAIFREDMGESHEAHLLKYGRSNTQLDRIDNDGDYCKDNCRWATRLQQLSNTRKNVLVAYRGESRTIAQWSRLVGIKASTIHRRIHSLGWGVEIALTTPVSRDNYLVWRKQ